MIHTSRDKQYQDRNNAESRVLINLDQPAVGGFYFIFLLQWDQPVVVGMDMYVREWEKRNAGSNTLLLDCIHVSIREEGFGE